MPRSAHVCRKSQKQFFVSFKSSKTQTLKETPLQCEVKQIKQADPGFTEWDDSMTTTRYVSKAELEYINRKREEEEKRREEELAAKKSGKKEVKKPAKK